MKRHYFSRGVSLLDIMVALLLLSGIIIALVNIINSNQQLKKSRSLAEQTEAYILTFAQFLNINHAMIIDSLAEGSTSITPNSINEYKQWPIDLAMQNLYKQTPCVVIAKNKVNNQLEAIMYYTSDNGEGVIDARQREVVRSALTILGAKGGLVESGHIVGNSGWSSDNASALVEETSKCGKELAPHSIAINLDLVPQWNYTLQPSTSVIREVSLGESGNIKTLPGHIANRNTLKSNLYFGTNNGLVLDNSNPQHPIKLAVQYNGKSSDDPTLGVGMNSAILISDTMQPQLIKSAGNPCNENELGKTTIDKGASGANQVLNRSTVVCTHNDMLCAKYNNGHNCYLSPTPNQVIFKNETNGIQDTTGSFTCPTAVPFASNPVAQISASGYYFATTNGNDIGCTITALNAKTDKQNYANCPLPNKYKWVQYWFWWLYFGINQFGNIPVTHGNQTPVSIGNTGGNITQYPEIGTLGNYQVTLGYKIVPDKLVPDCQQVCNQLPSPNPSSVWLVAINQRINGRNINLFDSSYYGSNSCGCWIYNQDPKVDTAYALAIVVLNKPFAKITQVTCSNMPEYTAQ